MHLAVLDETEVAYIDKVESKQRIRMLSANGKRGPAHCTRVGKALAFLDPAQQRALVDRLAMTRFTPKTFTSRSVFLRHPDEIRARGYAKDLEEHEAGIRCTAAAILNYRGRVVAGLSVTAPSFRLSLKRLDEIAPLVVRTATNISRSLGRKIR